mgnify:CR=1 FL=1
MVSSPTTNCELRSTLQRLHRICHLLYRNSGDLTAAQLATLCEVNKHTIQRDLHDLQEEGVPLWDDGGRPPRYGIIAGYYLPPIHLTLGDALARYADTFDPHIAEALAKLAGILPEGMAEHVHATIHTLLGKQENSQFVEVLRVLALDWASRRKVRIRRQAAGSENVHDYVLSPYFIEPSATGNATYVIGHASYFEALHTFKVERILEAKLTAESFEVPEATRRVQETCWHPSQVLEELPDGGCALRLQVAAPEEMVYWIRGWGPQVVVLAPGGCGSG